MPDQRADSDNMGLPEDYAVVCTVPHRETILRQVLDDFAGHYGPDAPLDLDRVNRLLAARRQPLATMTEINAWYGVPVPVDDLTQLVDPEIRTPRCSPLWRILADQTGTPSMRSVFTRRARRLTCKLAGSMTRHSMPRGSRSRANQKPS